MASGVYNIFKSELMKARINLTSDTIKVALLNSNHTFDPSSVVNQAWSDISVNETSGTGYVSGGKILSGTAVNVDNNDNEGVFSANNATWSASTITASHAVIYDDTTTPKFLIASIDFNQEVSSTNGNFQIQWDIEGIINLN